MHRLVVVFAGVFIVALSGCGKEGLELHEVTGTVKFKDGTVPQGDKDMSTITFTPVDPMQGKAASSKIEPDGAFKLWTLRQGDGGAIAGDYSVTLNVMTGYPRGRQLVASQYTNPNETPLAATVKAGEKNHFDFQVDKP